MGGCVVLFGEWGARGYPCVGLREGRVCGEDDFIMSAPLINPNSKIKHNFLGVSLYALVSAKMLLVLFFSNAFRIQWCILDNMD